MEEVTDGTSGKEVKSREEMEGKEIKERWRKKDDVVGKIPRKECKAGEVERK